MQANIDLCFTLLELLQWAASGTTFRRKQLVVQLVAGVAQRLDDRLVALSSGQVSSIAKVELHSSAGDGAVSKQLAVYWQGVGEIITETPMFMSAAPDKSRVGSKGILNSPVVLPTNQLGWPCPQDSDIGSFVNIKDSLLTSLGFREASHWGAPPPRYWYVVYTSAPALPRGGMHLHTST